MARLGDVCEILDSKRVPITASNRKSGIYPYYGANGIQDYVDDYIFDDELVLLAEDGGHFGSTEKPIAYRVSGKCWVNNHAHVLKPKADLDVDYLCYSLMFRDISSIVNGATRQKLTQADMREIEITLIPLGEQLAIVEKLNKIFALISLRKQQLSKLDELVKSRFIELFGEVETLTHRWNVKSFADVTINLDSTRKPVKDADRQKMQGEYPYYGATGIVDYVNDYRIDGTFLLISEDGKALEFRNKDIAFIASGKIWVNNHAHVLRCTEDIQMVFLKYYMNFRNISDWVTGIDQKKLNRANMDKIPVGLPPIGLQKQFSTFVGQTDKTKLTIQQSLEKLELLKKSLMQEYFG